MRTKRLSIDDVMAELNRLVARARPSDRRNLARVVQLYRKQHPNAEADSEPVFVEEWLAV
jgi:hypothetical protein